MARKYDLPRAGFVAPSDARWRHDAACRCADPDLFFPDDRDHVSAAKAVAICQTCPVADACLQDALYTREQHGIRGGLTPRGRHQLLVARRRAVHHSRDADGAGRPSPGRRRVAVGTAR